MHCRRSKVINANDGAEEQRGEKSSGALSSGNKGRSGSDPTAADARVIIIMEGDAAGRPSPCGMDSLGYIAPRRMRCHGDGGEM